MEFCHRRLGHFKCEERLCTPNMVREMILGKISCSTSTLVSEAYTEGKQTMAK